MPDRYKGLTAVCILLAMLLTSCGSRTEVPAATKPAAPTAPVVTEPVPVPTAPPAPAETVAQTHPAEETAPPAETEEPAAELPYLQRIAYEGQSIFDGPGYDYAFVGTVEKAGTYTIVEEAWDVEDHLWGRLKSGAGWVDLTDIRSEERMSEPLRANYADDRLLGSGNFHRYVGCTDEYAVHVAFRANETLTDVQLYSMEIHETLELGEELFSLARLEPGKPLVADLDFPGDMSTYAIRFTDSGGTQRYLTVYISGRNGALEQSEYVH